jgi:para-nitrobenzyl esterase
MRNRNQSNPQSLLGRVLSILLVPLCGLLLVSCESWRRDAEPDPGRATLQHVNPPPAAKSAPPSWVGHSWRLVRILSMDDRVFEPSDGTDYVVEFEADGSVSILADCNRGRGSWAFTPPSGLEIGLLAMTRAQCPPDSLHDRFVSDLGHVRSFVMRDGRLFMATMADGAILEFAPLSTETSPSARSS